MKKQDLRRFLHQDVVGQMKDGLFFEGHVTLQAGKVIVVKDEGVGQHSVGSDSVRWMVRAVRYC